MSVESDRPVRAFAAKGVIAVAVAMMALLLAVSGRYGYHRDELYFLSAGRHLAWGYPDQPPLAPFVARLMSALSPGSVVVLRLPAVLASGAIIILTGLIARELGAGRAGQVLAAGVVATAPVFLGLGHLLGTTVFDVLAWAVLLWLIVRLLRRDGDPRQWLLVGVVAGVGLMDSTLVAFLLAGVVAGMIIVGPRSHVRSPWLWAGIVVAAVMWLPYLDWQLRHGLPQLAESRAIAAGQSGSSQPRWQVMPFQLLLVGPLLAPVWIAGLVRLFRSPELRWARCLAVAYIVLAVVFVATGGKGYYLAGMYPVLTGAGAEPTLAWARRVRAGRKVLVAAFVLSLPPTAIALPLLPQRSLQSSGLVGVNYDLGEQVGWPAYVDQIAAAYHSSDAAAIVTSNYGEAGAVNRYGGPLGLPRAHSGQTGFWEWGPPADSAARVLAVGVSSRLLDRSFAQVRLVTRLHNRFGLDNDEQDVPVWLCTGRRAPWRELWPRYKST